MNRNGNTRASGRPLAGVCRAAPVIMNVQIRESEHIDRRVRKAPRHRQILAPDTDDRGASRRMRYLSSDRARLAASCPAKLPGDLSAAVKALRAPSVSPTFSDAMPRWY